MQDKKKPISKDTHDTKHNKSVVHHLKHKAAEAMEENQWKKHPGGG